jgi:hypothetical protein
MSIKIDGTNNKIGAKDTVNINAVEIVGNLYVGSNPVDPNGPGDITTINITQNG